jgi:hypothetical protein
MLVEKKLFEFGRSTYKARERHLVYLVGDQRRCCMRVCAPWILTNGIQLENP